jgi:predicted nucleotidyltransferase
MPYGRKWILSDIDNLVIHNLSQVNKRHEAIRGRVFTFA